MLYKKTGCTMLYKSVHHLELAVQGITEPKKCLPPPQNARLKKKLGLPLLYHSVVGCGRVVVESKLGERFG